MRTEIIYELDHSDESLRSISSGNIICITPTKYKCTNKPKSDIECQCSAHRRKHEIDQDKCMQICSSILKSTRQPFNENQGRKCPPCCFQSSANTPDSYVCVRLPQEVQSEEEIPPISNNTSPCPSRRCCRMIPCPPPCSPPSRISVCRPCYAACPPPKTCKPCRPPPCCQCPPPTCPPCPPCPPPSSQPPPSRLSMFRPPPPTSYQPGPPTSYQPDPPTSYQPGPPISYQRGPPTSYQPDPPSSYQPGPQSSYQPGPPTSYQPDPPISYQRGPPTSYQPGSPSYLPSPTFYQPNQPPPCQPCKPPPCRPCPPPLRQSPPTSYQPCPPPPCQPCPPPPCRPSPPPSTSFQPCRPCPPPPCRPCPPPPCPPPPCRPPPCSPPPCRPCPSCCQPCPPPCPPPPSRAPQPSPSRPCDPCCPSRPRTPPCTPPPCRPCTPPPCRPCPPPPCRPCTPPPCKPCPPFSSPPRLFRCCDPCPPCGHKCCKPSTAKIFPSCTKCCPSKASCKPFPLRPRQKSSRRTVCCNPCTPPPSCCPSRCSVRQCPFQDKKPQTAPPGFQCEPAKPEPPPGCQCKPSKPEHPPGCQCKPSKPEPPPGCQCKPSKPEPPPGCQCEASKPEHPPGCQCKPSEPEPSPGCQCESSKPEPPPEKSSQSIMLHVPCKFCGIPPCAAISSICNQSKQDIPSKDSSALQKPKSSGSQTNSLKTQTNKSKTTICNPIPNAGFKSVSKLCAPSKKIVWEPCDEDKSVNSKDDDSVESCLSTSSIPSVPPDESRSCESLDYPCKPLKPKVSVIKETSSEESLTCPSKKPVCPAIPPPCPGAGNEPCPAFPPKPCPNRKQSTGDEGLRKTDQFDNRRRSTQEILMPVTIHSRSPLQEVHDNKRKYNPSEAPQDIQTPDEVPSISSNSPPRPEKNHPQIQVFTCSTQNQGGFPPRKDCGCCLETCKCSQTATHEEKDIQCPAFRQCTCQTEHKEDANVQCNCKEHAGVTCKCDENDEEKDSLCQCKKSSSSSSSNSDSGSFMSCICCKKEKILKNLINKIQLCEPCNQVNRTNFYPHQYCDPVHSCVCYKLVERNLLCEFKQTLTELERLDIYQQYCEVLKNCKCCKECGCKCKLPKKFKNGCAYFLKLEDACPNPRCGEEGSDMGEEEEGEDEENYLPEVTVKVPNCRGPCARHQKDGGKQETRKFMSCPSIQNYLCTMKPEFVARAERRRRILKNATIEREENSEHRKLHFIEKINYLNQRKRCEPASSAINVSKPYGVQTKAYCVFDIEINEEPKKVQPRVFKSFKEMKELTRRRYLHLTEVKSKKNVYKEKRLREANRLLANTFTRRLQKSTLRGTVDIPWNVKVVSF